MNRARNRRCAGSDVNRAPVADSQRCQTTSGTKRQAGGFDDRARASNGKPSNCGGLIADREIACIDGTAILNRRICCAGVTDNKALADIY